MTPKSFYSFVIVMAVISSQAICPCSVGCSFDEYGNLIGCQDGYGFRNYDNVDTTCVPCLENCLSCPVDDKCSNCKPNFLLSEDGSACSCPTETGYELSGENCVCNQCIYEDGQCKACPGEFVPNPSPEAFFENAAFTMSVIEVYRDEINTTVFRISFSEEQIVLLSPLSQDTVNDWLTVSLEGYENPKDYTYRAGYNEFGTIDINITFNTDISATNMQIQFMDQTLLVSDSGKKLENGSSSVYFAGFSKALEKIPVETLTTTTETLGQATASVSVATFAATSVMGSSVSLFAKFFQIIEMTSVVKIINFKIDPLFQTFLDFTNNLSGISPYSLFTEKIMYKDLLNSEAGPYRGKLTGDGVAPWLLMDFGYLGVVIIVLQLLLLVLNFMNLQGKWHERAEKVRVFNVQLLQAYSVDFCGKIMTSIGTFGYKSMNFWRVASVLVALWLLVVFTLDLIKQHTVIEAIYLRDKKNLTKTQNSLRKMYLDGIDKDGVKESYFIRHYNLYFTLKFIAIILIIYSLQFLQAVQILASLAITVAWLIKSLLMFCRHKFFKSRLTKCFRLSQDFGFTIVLLITGLFYLEYLGSVEFGRTFKMVIVYFAIILVCLNVLMEIILLVKAVFELTCCKKKKLNKVGVEPDKDKPDTQIKVKDTELKNTTQLSSPEEVDQQKAELDPETKKKDAEENKDAVDEISGPETEPQAQEPEPKDISLGANSSQKIAKKITQNLGDSDSISEPRVESQELSRKEGADLEEHPGAGREINLTSNVHKKSIIRQSREKLIFPKQHWFL